MISKLVSIVEEHSLMRHTLQEKKKKAKSNVWIIHNLLQISLKLPFLQKHHQLSLERAQEKGYHTRPIEMMMRKHLVSYVTKRRRKKVGQFP